MFFIVSWSCDYSNFNITVNDSIIAEADNIKVVRKTMSETLTQYDGAVPGLKVELFDKAKVFKSLDKQVEEDWSRIVQSLKRKSNSSWLPATLSHLRKVPLIYRLLVIDGNTLYSTSYVNPIRDDDYFE